MTQLIEGQKYRLPNGEIVTARTCDGLFLLEFKRKYRPAVSVAADGRLILKGDEMGYTVDNLTVVEEDEPQAGR